MGLWLKEKATGNHLFSCPVWVSLSFSGLCFQQWGLDFLSVSIKVSGLLFPLQTCSGWHLRLESISGWRWLQSSVCLVYCFPGWQQVGFSSGHCPWLWLKQALDSAMSWNAQQHLAFSIFIFFIFYFCMIKLWRGCSLLLLLKCWFNSP